MNEATREENNRINTAKVELFLRLCRERDGFLETFRAHLRPSESGCVLWKGSLNKQGYGQFVFRFEGKAYCIRAHRATWALKYGISTLPSDHHCKVKGCNNTDHLEPVTTKENNLRSDCASGLNARKTHCNRGHEFTPENTHLVPGGRSCRKCERIFGKEWLDRHPGARNAARDRRRAEKRNG